MRGRTFRRRKATGPEAGKTTTSFVKRTSKSMRPQVHPEGFEPPTLGSEDRRISMKTPQFPSLRKTGALPGAVAVGNSIPSWNPGRSCPNRFSKPTSPRSKQLGRRSKPVSLCGVNRELAPDPPFLLLALELISSAIQGDRQPSHEATERFL